MATNVKILLRRGKRAELTGQTLVSGEMGYTTDTNQLYVGTEAAVNEIRFDPFTNAHATIQSWLDSADCPTPNLVIDEDLVITDIPAGKIDGIMTALNTYSQSVVFNTTVATFNLGELLTQYKKKPTVLTSPNLIPITNSIISDFTVEGESISVGGTSITAGSFVVNTSYKINVPGTTDFTLIGSADNNANTVFKATGVGTGTGTAFDSVSSTSLLSTLQANAAIKAANVEVTSNVAVTKFIFTKIDGAELNITFPTTADASSIGFTQSVLSVTAGAFVKDTNYTITSLGTDTLATVIAGAFVTGTVYTILVPGTTDFTLIGSANSTIGTVFTATGTGAGTGTATRVSSTKQANWQVAGAPAISAAGSFVVGTKYSIVSAGTTTFTSFGSANNNAGTIFTATNVGVQEVGAGSFIVGYQYTISTVGNTNFTLVGSLNNTVGTIFTATGVGTGTGFANYQGTGTATSVIVGTVFKAIAVGQGDGVATYDNGVNTVAAIAGNDVYANGKVISSTQSGSITTVVAEVSENSDYFKYQQEGTPAKPYANAPDNSPYFYFGTPSTPNYSTLSPSVESTSVTGSTDTKIGLFGHKRMNVEVLTEESRNQLFANQHLKSHASSTGLRSDLYKKELKVTQATINATAAVEGKQYEIIVAGTTNFTLNGAANSTVGTRFFANATVPIGTGTVQQIGTFLKYDSKDSTSFFIDYSLKQTDSSNIFVRVGTLRVINGVPQAIMKTSITDENTEVWQDLDSDSVQDANEFSNITFNAALNGTNIEINYTQSATFSTEISYTVKRWTM